MTNGEDQYDVLFTGSVELHQLKYNVLTFFSTESAQAEHLFILPSNKQTKQTYSALCWSTPIPLKQRFRTDLRSDQTSALGSKH